MSVGQKPSRSKALPVKSLPGQKPSRSKALPHSNSMVYADLGWRGLAPCHPLDGAKVFKVL